MRHQSRLSLSFLAACAMLTLGCEEQEPTAPAPAAPPTAARCFDPATAGALSGRVTWAGDAPTVPTFEIPAFIASGEPGRKRLVRENPNAPAIDPQTRGVVGAVVFLRGVAPERARPWHHPPARVEVRDRRLHVVQGETDARVGFVKRGDAVEIVSREDCLHVVRGTGAAFFSLPLPDPGKPRSRPLTETGVVEMTSGANQFWMRAYLFVADHPYFTRTDAQGRFRLDQVPPGRYRLVCWMPSWVKRRADRDPETGLVSRLEFRAAVEVEREVEVRSGTTGTVDYCLSGDLFTR